MNLHSKNFAKGLFLVLVIICIYLISILYPFTKIADTNVPLEGGGITAGFYLFNPTGYKPTFTTVSKGMCTYVGEGHIVETAAIREDASLVSQCLLDVPDFSSLVEPGKTIEWRSILMDKNKPYVVGIFVDAPVMIEPPLAIPEEVQTEDTSSNDDTNDNNDSENGDNSETDSPLIDTPAANIPLPETPAVEVPLVLTPEEEYQSYITAINNYNLSAANAMKDETIDSLIQITATSNKALKKGIKTDADKENLIKSLSDAINTVQSEYDTAKSFSDQANQKLSVFVSLYSNSEDATRKSDITYQQLSCSIINADIEYLLTNLSEAYRILDKLKSITY